MLAHSCVLGFGTTCSFLWFWVINQKTVGFFFFLKQSDSRSDSAVEDKVFVVTLKCFLRVRVCVCVMEWDRERERSPLLAEERGRGASGLHRYPSFLHPPPPPFPFQFVLNVCVRDISIFTRCVCVTLGVHWRGLEGQNLWTAKWRIISDWLVCLWHLESPLQSRYKCSALNNNWCLLCIFPSFQL